MSGGHKTSAIPRPRGARRVASVDDPVREGRGRRRRAKRRHDLTQPIAIERQLVTTRRNRWVLALLAVGVIGALGAALFVLPVQAWLRQQDDLDAKQAELAVLDDANNQLQQENDRLQTPEGAKEAAREQLGVTDEAEERISVLPGGAAPLTLPAGWPYDTVTQIIGARASIVAAAAQSATPASTVPVAATVAP